MNSDNTVFFSTANTGYVEYAITSLLSIRKYAPAANLFIISSGLNDRERVLLSKLKIGVHEVDLSDMFYQTWQYPVDCFYIFAGPEFLLKLGYKFSVYVDGDTICKSDPFIASFEGISGVEAVSQAGDYTSIFGDDWSIIQKEWKLPNSLNSHPRVNSGIVYFNNKSMHEFELLKKSAAIYDQCIESNVPRKGDDSLFSLLQYVYRDELNITSLPLAYNYVLQFTEDRSYPIENLVFFHFSIDKPWKANPYTHEQDALDCYNPLIKEWLLGYSKINKLAYVNLVGGTVERLSEKSINKLRDKHNSLKRLSLDVFLWVDGRKYSVVRRKRNIKKTPLKLYWWQDYSRGIHNFGDEITKSIILRQFGFRSSLATVDEAEIAGAGSILEIVGERKAKKPIYIWGSGFIQPKNEARPYDDSSFRVRAVRGDTTVKRLGLKKSDVALGDPGLLASLVYPRSQHSSDKVGVVVHYAEKDLPIVDEMRLDHRFMIIDPLDTPESVAINITSCKLILSSSLHGLIFADSFGIPNVHIKFSEKITGGEYKFKDYYSATHRNYSAVSVAEMFKDEKLLSLVEGYQKVGNLRAVQKQLVRFFPKEIR